jgi:hypothetical protein
MLGRWNPGLAAAQLALASVLAASPAWAQPAPGAGARSEPGSAAGPPAPATGVPLEKLLRVPSSAGPVDGEPRRGGRTRGEWQARFAAAESELVRARKGVDDSRRKLEEIAPDQAWSMGAPGLPVQVSPAETPIDFKLRQELRRQREEVDFAERRLQELAIEANLAQVPDEWRRPDGEPAKPAPGSGS